MLVFLVLSNRVDSNGHVTSISMKLSVDGKHVWTDIYRPDGILHRVNPQR